MKMEWLKKKKKKKKGISNGFFLCFP